jgi:hypothetical protein
MIIFQSQLNATGNGNIPFPSLGREDRKRVAAQTFRALGLNHQAILLEINNPNAVAGLKYVQDTQPIPMK